MCLGQAVSLSLALTVCRSQSTVSLHQVRRTWQLWSGVHHGSTTGSPPKGTPAFVYVKGSFLQAVSHEGLVLLMRIYLHFTGRRWRANCRLIRLKHHISSPGGASGDTSCSAENKSEGWKREEAGERVRKLGQASKTHPSLQR